LTPAGQPDPAFSGDGVVRIGFRGVSTFAETIALDPRGRVLVGAETLSTIEDDTYASVARLRVDDGPPDADADGVLDGDDRCPEQYGPRTRAGCDAIRRKVGIRAGRKGFRGSIRCAYNRRLGSIRPGHCVEVGRVTVFKRRPGRDRVVGRTSAEYTWRLRVKVGSGRYYARLSAVRARDMFVYAGDVSPAVRVRR
jgi:hypothetical protein